MCVIAVLSKSHSEEKKNTLKFKAVHLSNEIAFWWRWKGCAAFPLWEGVCSVYAQTPFFLSAKSMSAVYERAAASLLRGHLFSTDLKVTQPLVYQYFTMMNNSSISCNWSLW